MPNHRKNHQVGEKFGSLTVISDKPKATPREGVYWLCECICGNTLWVFGQRLRKGGIRSCGCLRSYNKLTHGQSSRGNTVEASPEYSAWARMVARCENPNRKDYERYGGRGISVYPAWRESFTAFYNYMGRKPSKSHSLDRIDNNGNYEPGNVKWSLPKEQANNRRGNSDNPNITIGGETRTFVQWCEKYNLRRKSIRARIKRGWSWHDAITTPVTKSNQNRGK